MGALSPISCLVVSKVGWALATTVGAKESAAREVSRVDSVGRNQSTAFEVERRLR
jgi:hypothetical protein